MPKRVKHRKAQRGNRAGTAAVGVDLSFGEFGLKALDRGWLKATQIEACRVSINRHMKRKGKVWIRVFPDKPVSKKPIETRMGKGKGNTEFWVAVVRPGTVLFELAGVTEHVAREAMRLAAAKLGIRTRFVSRHGQ
jgi:large subunit ribosomal protein L16